MEFADFMQVYNNYYVPFDLISLRVICLLGILKGNSLGNTLSAVHCSLPLDSWCVYLHQEGDSG